MDEWHHPQVMVVVILDLWMSFYWYGWHTHQYLFIKPCQVGLQGWPRGLNAREGEIPPACVEAGQTAWRTAAIIRVNSNRASLMYCLLFAFPFIVSCQYSRVLWWFSDAAHGITVFYPFPESSSICCWDVGSACLSQPACKLAGEEGFACANYILIIRNVVANQASIDILEHIAPLCRLQIEACSVGLRKRSWDQTRSWMHSSPPQLDMAACLVHMLGTDRAAITHGDKMRLHSASPAWGNPGERQRAQESTTQHTLWTLQSESCCGSPSRTYTTETHQHEEKWK